MDPEPDASLLTTRGWANASSSSRDFTPGALLCRGVGQGRCERRGHRRRTGHLLRRRSRLLGLHPGRANPICDDLDDQNNFGTAWLPAYDDLLGQGRLHGIDMTIFSGFDPQHDTNGTLRFTPSTMALLAMDNHKNLTPIAVYPRPGFTPCLR